MEKIFINTEQGQVAVDSYQLGIDLTADQMGEVLGAFVNRKHWDEHETAFLRMHPTLLANCLRACLNVAHKYRPLDGRLPEWARSGNLPVPFI